MSTVNTINLFNELAVIKTKYGERFYTNKKATKAAAELWGCQSNKHGVCKPLKKEPIAESGKCRAELLFCKTTKSFWLLGISVMSSYNGRGYAPSEWDTTGYPSYDEARLAGVVQLISFFEKVVSDNSSCNSASNRENARKILRILEAGKTPQMTLF